MNVKKKLLASLALAALAFCAMSAPIPSYRVATNIAYAVSSTVVSNTVTRSYIEGLVSGSGGLVNATNIINDITRDSTQATLINRTDGQEDNAIVTIGSVDKQSNLAGLMTVEDKKTLDLHVANTDNPHGVTAEQVGALSISRANTNQTFDWNTSGGGVRLFGAHYGTGIGLSLNSIGGMLYNYHDGTEDLYLLPTGKNGTLALQSDVESKADKAVPTISGNLAALTADGNLADSGIAKGNVATKNNLEGYLPLTGGIITGSLQVNESLCLGSDLYATYFSTAYNTSWGDVVPALYYSRWYYLPNGSEYPKMSDNEIAVKGDISATNPTFSNAVLAVGLNIDTNSVAVLNEIADTFGGFPIGGTATTVGGLLAALAAAAAWLKKNKVGSFDSVGGASATVENGVAKLDDFFTKSNSLLNGRLAYERNETGLKDRAFNTLSFDGTEYNLSTVLEAVTPTASGQPRDLLIVATATAATTISYTAGTIKGDKPTIDGSGTWLITLTEYASGVWYCRQIKMEDAA